MSPKHHLLAACLLFACSLLESQATAETVVYNFSGGFQSFTVGAGVTQLTIEARGAQGGGDKGGLGASITGSFSVTPGETLGVLVGGRGFVTSQGVNYGAGGGGGTFVYRDLFDPLPLIAAGGGGGQAEDGFGVAGWGGAGSANSNSTFGLTNSSSSSGGTGGNGGQGGLNIGALSTGGGGVRCVGLRGRASLLFSRWANC